MITIGPEHAEELRALKQTYTLRHCKVVRFYDGDSFWVSFPMTDRYAIFREMEVRVSGVDCPEINDPRPDIRKIAVDARDLTIACIKGSEYWVDLELVQWDKYPRLNAVVKFYQRISPDKRKQLTLATVLIEAKVARPYNGQGPRPW